MAKKPEAAESRSPAGYERKKLTAEYLDLAEMKAQGETFIGTFVGSQTGEWKDKATGEVKDLVRLIFDRRNPTKLGESLGRVIILQNAGLKKAMEDALVAASDTVEVEHMGKEDIGGGRTVNQYDIFAVSSSDLPRQLPRATVQNPGQQAGLQ